MARLKKETVIFCLQRLLRPLIRFGLSNNLRVQDLLECIKSVLVDTARSHLLASGEKVTESRLSVMTGIHRRDIKRLMDEEFKFDELQSLIMKVVGQWQTDKQFITDDKLPKPLNFKGENSDFNQLVEKVSKDVNPATVLFELERVGMVEKKEGHIILLQDTYTPGDNFEDALSIASDDIEHLLAAVRENAERIVAFGQPGAGINLHARTEYNNIRPSGLREIREWLIKEGHALHRRARELFAKHDQDINPIESYTGLGARVVLGTFSKVYESFQENSISEESLNPERPDD
jgi:hypothetical protein